MITNQDRSYWFGASDSSMVVTKNRKTKSFLSWWEVKMGEKKSDFSGSKFTDAGNNYEHPILLSITEKMNLDRQILIEKIRLRVNYDGDYEGVIYEVKTHKNNKNFEVSKANWRQTQVEIYAYKKMQEELNLPPFKKLYIVSYGLFPDEYNVVPEIDYNRLKYNPIAYDKHFIKDEYLPYIKELSRCLKKGKFPR